MKGTALIDGDLKLLKVGRGKGAKWALFDVAKDPGEKKDVSGEHPEILEALKAKAEKLTTSVEASSEGSDYPEGKVLQPQRGTPWMEMPEYQKLYPTFQELKPSWNPPGKGRK